MNAAATRLNVMLGPPALMILRASRWRVTQFISAGIRSKHISSYASDYELISIMLAFALVTMVAMPFKNALMTRLSAGKMNNEIIRQEMSSKRRALFNAS